MIFTLMLLFQMNCAMEHRGDAVMGFSHEATTHAFKLSDDGGAIEVVANDPKDSKSIEAIRAHLREIAKAFAKGDFAKPKAIHEELPDGAARCRESVAVVIPNSTTTGALVLARLSRAFTPSFWRSKMSCAPSPTPANANRPSAPTTTDIPVPPTATRTPTGLAFAIPEAITICPDTTPMP